MNIFIFFIESFCLQLISLKLSFFFLFIVLLPVLKEFLLIISIKSFLMRFRATYYVLQFAKYKKNIVRDQSKLLYFYE